MLCAHLRRLYDIRSHKGALRFPTPGINIFLGWNVRDPHVLATVSDSNVVTFLDMRKGKYLRTLKNRQEVSRPRCAGNYHRWQMPGPSDFCAGSAVPCKVCD